jgi:hypothetical protein
MAGWTLVQRLCAASLAEFPLLLRPDVRAVCDQVPVQANLRWFVPRLTAQYCVLQVFTYTLAKLRPILLFGDIGSHTVATILEV